MPFRHWKFFKQSLASAGSTASELRRGLMSFCTVMRNWNLKVNLDVTAETKISPVSNSAIQRSTSGKAQDDSPHRGDQNMGRSSRMSDWTWDGFEQLSFKLCLETLLKPRHGNFASLAVDDNLKCVCNSVASRLILAQLWKMAHARKSCIIKHAALNWHAWKNVSIPDFFAHFADIRYSGRLRRIHTQAVIGHLGHLSTPWHPMQPFLASDSWWF